MNLLLFDKHELDGNLLKVAGRRAAHLTGVLKVTIDDTVRVGAINGPVGKGRVRHITPEAVELEIQLTETVQLNTGIELILALPRPIMLQRILKQATVMGVRKFHLIRSRRVEKSFFQSPVLKADKTRSLLLEGMEQAMDTHLPEVNVHARFKPFIEDVVPQMTGSGLFAHPDAPVSLHSVHRRLESERPILLAIGPEGGWSDYEYQRFVEIGFNAFSMGSRILHVDTAVVALLAQLQLLQDLRQR